MSQDNLSTSPIRAIEGPLNFSDTTEVMCHSIVPHVILGAHIHTHVAVHSTDGDHGCWTSIAQS